MKILFSFHQREILPATTLIKVENGNFDKNLAMPTVDVAVVIIVTICGIITAMVILTITISTMN